MPNLSQWQLARMASNQLDVISQLTTEQLRDIYSAICQELAQRETRESKEFDADERMAA